ncbi:arginase family protein [Nonomuraea sp. NPDC050556]|uniref:arginase family protein n=1 Tax=Nonomuraea sp. NPDC050556 TaxID=3364369 RepID=UPI0037AB5251
MVIVRVRTNLGLVPGVERLGDALLEAGLAEGLGAELGPVVEAPPYRHEREHDLLNRDALARVAAEQAAVVGEVLDSERFPIVLGGDDSVIFGTLLALRERGVHGLVFLDAHTDFYPPAGSPTGQASDSELYLAFHREGALGWSGPLVTGERAALIGHRDPDEPGDTGELVADSGALVITLEQVRELGVAETARRALARVGGPFLLHIDADVLDDDLMPAVDYRLPGGLSAAEFTELVSLLPAAALDVAIYNPALDPDGTAGRTLARCLVEGLGQQVEQPVDG